MDAFIVSKPSTAALRALNYTPEVEALRRRGHSSVRLGSLVSSMGPAYGSVFVRRDCAREHGVELITQGDMFAAEPIGRLIRLDSMPQPERHRVRRWQVLIAGAGTLGEDELFGRSIIADSRLVDKYVGPHAMALTFKEPGGDDNLFVYAFLCSSIGIRATRSTAFGTKILGLRKDLLADLPIPHAGPATKTRIASLVRTCVEARERYAKELQAARAAIETLPNMTQAHKMCAERRMRSVVWRDALPTLNAWNFASTGRALAYLGETWRTRLADVLEPGGAFNGPRFARIDCRSPHGIAFMSQRDVFLIRSVAKRIARPRVPDHMLYVPAGAVLAGSHGQITDGALFGRVELASFGADKCGVTQDMLRLLFRESEREVAFAYLSTVVGHRLLKSTAVGTTIPSMRLDLLAQLPYPEVSPSLRKQVVAHVRNSELARNQATAAETEAIRIIEEEVLPEWLA